MMLSPDLWLSRHNESLSNPRTKSILPHLHSCGWSCELGDCNPHTSLQLRFHSPFAVLPQLTQAVPGLPLSAPEGCRHSAEPEAQGTPSRGQSESAPRDRGLTRIPSSGRQQLCIAWWNTYLTRFSKPLSAMVGKMDTASCLAQYLVFKTEKVIYSHAVSK